MDQTQQAMVNNIEGMLTREEGKLLYRLALGCGGRGCIVEVGSWKGKSTVCLAYGSKAGAGARVYAVDPHTGSPEHKERYGKVNTYEEFINNIRKAGVNDVVTPVVSESAAAAGSISEPVELVFIDGAHEYEAVKTDIETWLPRLVEGGMIAFHDSVGAWKGVNKAVDRYIHLSREFSETGFLDSITYAKKVSRSMLYDRLRNVYLMALKKYPLLFRVIPTNKKFRVRVRRLADHLQ